MCLTLELTLALIVCFAGYILFWALFRKVYDALKKAEKEDKKGGDRDGQ